jgi:hypothetical protein
MTSPADQAATAARIGVGAGLLGVDVDWIIEQIIESSGGLEGATVFTDADVRTLTVGATVPDDKWTPRHMARLAAGITTSKALARMSIARVGRRWLETGSGLFGAKGEGMAGMYATLAVHGPASLDEDIATTTAVGLDQTIANELAARLSTLTKGGERRPRVIRTTAFTGDEPTNHVIEIGAEVPHDVIDLITSLASELQITSAQLKLIKGVHQILAGGRSVWVRIGASQHALEPGVTLTYASVTLDNAMRVINGLSSTDGAMQRWGFLVGALGATDVSALEVHLGPRDPMPARFGLVVRP